MIDLDIAKTAVNPDRLHADLKAALGEVCFGLSFARGSVVVHLDDRATPEQQAQARQIVAAHDPASLTPAQQTARDRDALPFFKLSPDDLAAHAATLDAATFQRETARAFALLRDLVRGK